MNILDPNEFLPYWSPNRWAHWTGVVFGDQLYCDHWPQLSAMLRDYGGVLSLGEKKYRRQLFENRKQADSDFDDFSSWLNEKIDAGTKDAYLRNVDDGLYLTVDNLTENVPQAIREMFIRCEIGRWGWEAFCVNILVHICTEEGVWVFGVSEFRPVEKRWVTVVPAIVRKEA